MRGFFGGVAQAGGNIAFTAPTVPDPVFSVTAGAYPADDYPKPLTIDCGDPYATIYLTWDGSTPTQTNYQMAVVGQIVGTAQVGYPYKAIAFRSGFNESQIIAASYTAIASPTCSAPTYSPVAGSYNNDQFPKSVILTSATAGSTIYYTINVIGTPTHGSPSVANGGTISIPANGVVRAIAGKAAFSDSPLSTGTFTAVVSTCVSPTFNPVAGSYNNDQFPKSVAITSTTPGVQIQYHIDAGANINIANGASVAVPVNGVLYAVSFKAAWNTSPITSGQYIAVVYTCASPTFNPTAGAYGGATYPKSVQINSSTAGATIWYYITGVTGWLNIANGASVSIAAGQTLNALARKTAWNDSATVSGLFTSLALSPVSFNPVNYDATVSGNVSVSMSTASSGCNIRYNKGTAPANPTSSSGTLIAASSGSTIISLTHSNQYIKAIAYKAGYSDSAVTQGGPYLWEL